jgi:hypothetical protein
MRQAIVVACACAFFLACFAIAFLYLQSASPGLRALAGGGMFFVLALGVLGRDAVRLGPSGQPGRGQAMDEPKRMRERLRRAFAFEIP